MRAGIPLPLPSPYIIGGNYESTVYAAGSYAVAGWPSANRAIYVPFSLPVPQMLTEIATWCTVTGSGNFDIGIYDENLVNRLFSLGSTALVADAINKLVLPTPMLLRAGARFYLALAVSTTSATIPRTANVALSLRRGGMAQQDSALPLPATATPATMATAFAPTFVLTFGD